MEARAAWPLIERGTPAATPAEKWRVDLGGPALTTASFASTAHELTDNGFDHIVAGLYGAATGGRAWKSAQAPIPGIVGARAVVMHTGDIVDGRMLMPTSANSPTA